MTGMLDPTPPKLLMNVLPSTFLLDMTSGRGTLETEYLYLYRVTFGAGADGINSGLTSMTPCFAHCECRYFDTLNIDF